MPLKAFVYRLMRSIYLVCETYQRAVENLRAEKQAKVGLDGLPDPYCCPSDLSKPCPLPRCGCYELFHTPRSTYVSESCDFLHDN